MLYYTYICHKSQPNVGKYTIHGRYEHGFLWVQSPGQPWIRWRASSKFTNVSYPKTKANHSRIIWQMLFLSHPFKTLATFFLPKLPLTKNTPRGENTSPRRSISTPKVLNTTTWSFDAHFWPRITFTTKSWRKPSAWGWVPPVRQSFAEDLCVLMCRHFHERRWFGDDWETI